MKRLIALGMVGVMGLGLAACSRDDKGLGDAPVGKKHEAPREVIVMPDEFSNVVFACDGHGHRIFVTTRDAAPVVISDPTCG